jgi:hypothetical protein
MTNITATRPTGKRRKPSWMRARALSACCGLALVLGSPALALADTPDTDYDARLGGYTDKMNLEKSGVAVTWMLFILLGAIGVGVLFKNPNRSHLD